jgi:hypothetical protein
MRPMARRRYPDCVARRGSARLRPLEDVVSLPQTSPLTLELTRALAAAGSLHGVRTDLTEVPVRPTSTTSEAGAYRFRKREPIDIRVSARSGRATLGFLHELGHFVDHQLGYDPRDRAWASAIHPAFSHWRAAAASLGSRPFAGGRSRRRYFGSAHEVWARAYTQTVLERSGDGELQRQLEALQRKDDPFVWPRREFEPVALEVERVFERLGLTQLALPLAA